MKFADQTDISVAQRMTAHAHVHGVSLIDTADFYSCGQSERVVGELIKAQRDHWTSTAWLLAVQQRPQPGFLPALKTGLLVGCWLVVRRRAKAGIEILDAEGMPRA